MKIFRTFVLILSSTVSIYAAQNNSAFRIATNAFSLQAQNGFADEYLEKAFEQLNKNPPPAPVESQQKSVSRIIAEIEKAAFEKRLYTIEDKFVEEIGWSGFPSIAALLRNPNSWVRAIAAQTLFKLDRQHSVPFLIALLSDKGRFDYMDDVPNYTVSDFALGMINQVIYGTLLFKKSTGDKDNPFAAVKSVQRYYWFHLPYCDWQNEPQKICFINFHKIFANLENAKFPFRFAQNDYNGINYVLIYESLTESAFKFGEKVEINLIFVHYGNRVRNIRWDVQDSAIHKFKLIAPNGEELKLKPRGLPPLPERTPVLQPQWNRSSLGKTLNLAEIYDLKQRGKYKFYYEYQPPKELEKDEQNRPLHLWYWNGKDYDNYYEFIIE